MTKKVTKCLSLLFVASMLFANVGSAQDKIVVVSKGYRTANQAAEASLFRGKWPRVAVDGHVFDLRGRVTEQKVGGDGYAYSGMFRHHIVGDDDEVHFYISIRKGQQPQIQLRFVEKGPFAWAKKKWVKFIPVIGQATYGAVKTSEAIRKELVGGWKGAAVRIGQLLAERADAVKFSS